MNKTTFKTLTTTGKKITKQDLEKAGFKVFDRTNEILEKVEFSKEKKTYDLEIVSVADLGFTNWVLLKDIYAKAKEMGYEPCPAEVAPLLRMNYKDQPLDEWLTIAMDAITDRGGNPKLFDVGHDFVGLWLHRNYGKLNGNWSANSRFVFVSRKSELKTESLNTSLDLLSLNLKKYEVQTRLELYELLHKKFMVSENKEEIDILEKLQKEILS